MDFFVYCISFQDYNLSEWQSKHERIWEWDEFDGMISWFGRFQCRMHSVRTNGPESNTWLWHFCLIRIVAQCLETWARVHVAQIPNSDIFAELEFLHSVQTHGPESMWLKYPIPTFSWIRIVAQRPDTWGRVHVAQIPDSDIFAGLELWHSVRTHGTESIQFKYPILTFLLD